MDIQKQLRTLLSENEFLQLQLEDLNNAIKKKDEEISFLNDGIDSGAALKSRIDNNLLEIDQLRGNLSLEAKKTVGAEQFSEDLENDLLKQIRINQADEKTLRSLNSENAGLTAMNAELEESAGLYPKFRSMKAELAETKSRLDLALTENQELKDQVFELKALLDHFKQQKPKQG